MKFSLSFLFLLLITRGFSQDSLSFLMVRTIGPLPFLEYGPGDDRLGGAKMTYLDTNIVLKVIDSLNTDYKVQLSKNHIAFIAKTNVELVPFASLRPYHLTGSWKVYGDSVSDYVQISVDEKLPYRSIQQINPSRIVVDIFGATSNTNWITQLNSVKEIKNTWYEQVEDDVLRVFIELRHSQHWGYAIGYDTLSGRLVIRVKRQPSVLDIKKLKIAIDAGHGGDNMGATGSQSKILEKDYTLLMAKDFASALKKAGVKKVFMTRTIDTSLTMVDRIMMLRQFDPDLLISIHLNSSSLDTVRGTSTYYRYIGFRSLSQSILRRMLELKLKEYGNIGSFNFALSGPAEYPNCLVEVAFLSNRIDEKRILDKNFHKLVARKITDGIKDWLIKIK